MSGPTPAYQPDRSIRIRRDEEFGARVRATQDHLDDVAERGNDPVELALVDALHRAIADEAELAHRVEDLAAERALAVDRRTEAAGRVAKFRAAVERFTDATAGAADTTGGQTVAAPAVDLRPHSRACGWRQHAHGPDCHTNCPTCGGKS